MAHYAFLNSDNVVVKVITGVNETVTQLENGIEVGGSSESWEQFYQSQPQHQGLICKRTSYNGNIRKQFCGIGFTYLADADVFVAPQPYGSWTLDKNYDWQPPIPKPLIDEPSWWDEENLEWVVISKPLTGGPYRWSEEDLEWVAV